MDDLGIGEVDIEEMQAVTPLRKILPESGVQSLKAQAVERQSRVQGLRVRSMPCGDIQRRADDGHMAARKQGSREPWYTISLAAMTRSVSRAVRCNDHRP
jgi:hypothetical protein